MFLSVDQVPNILDGFSLDKYQSFLAFLCID
jgi:hypothetical protein